MCNLLLSIIIYCGNYQPTWCKGVSLSLGAGSTAGIILSVTMEVFYVITLSASITILAA